MKRRCYSPSDTSYPKYGARGITVADEWRNDFPAFLAYIGPKPSPRHTIDRIDGTKGYVPGNVRWATYHEQAVNRRAKLHGTPKKLDAWEVRFIRHWVLLGYSQNEVARAFSVSGPLVNAIVQQRIWRYA